MHRKIVVLWLAFCLFALPALAQTNQLPQITDGHSQIIRVHLTKLGVTDRLDVTLTASYLLEVNYQPQAYFQAGSELSFQVKEGALYLYHGGMKLQIEEDLWLKRTEKTERTGWMRTNFPALYMGDLHLVVRDGKLIPVLSIHVEDYLLGVVPYEMSNSFPLEALKAQAVAARTYALRSQNEIELYDVVDNTNDQVFYGYTSGNERAEQAVQETRGVCGLDGDKLAQCYYSASNGGQMELPQTVWPGREHPSIYAFGEDPYDLENEESTVRRFVLKKKYNGEEAPYTLRSLLAQQLKEPLEKLGFDATEDSIRVNEVLNAAVDTPTSLNSSHMTMLRLNLSISGRTRSEIRMQISDPDSEEVSLFRMEPEATSESTFAPVVTTEPLPSPSPLYGPFMPLAEPVSVDIPIFPTAEAFLGMDILSHYDNEIWSITETNDSFVLEARRYGHGVGMSQRGAEQMAEKYQKTFEEILSFYYPGMKLAQYPTEKATETPVPEKWTATAGPAPSPTPKPTLMPVTLEAQTGQYFAHVTGISEDSSLNLRSEPSLNGKIVMRLYYNQKLLVVEECPQEGWVKVQTDTASGYVVKSYLTTVN